jgi:predicted Zn-ribbon and HTH transcriptional regulator
VITSPPYLNAIDYMRGHKLSLIWLGYKLAELRTIRAKSIGTERAPESGFDHSLFDSITTAMTTMERLSKRHQHMVERYAEDVYRMMSEIARVLKRRGRAVLVVGNLCLRSVFVKNSAGIAQAGAMVGLRLVDATERELPESNRYLPIPPDTSTSLGRRMRTESVLTFSYL